MVFNCEVNVDDNLEDTLEVYWLKGEAILNRSHPRFPAATPM